MQPITEETDEEIEDDREDGLQTERVEEELMTEETEVVADVAIQEGAEVPESIAMEKSLPSSTKTMTVTAVNIQPMVPLERMEEPTRSISKSHQPLGYLQDYDCTSI